MTWLFLTSVCSELPSGPIQYWSVFLRRCESQRVWSGCWPARATNLLWHWFRPLSVPRDCWEVPRHNLWSHTKLRQHVTSSSVLLTLSKCSLGDFVSHGRNCILQSTPTVITPLMPPASSQASLAWLVPSEQMQWSELTESLRLLTWTFSFSVNYECQWSGNENAQCFLFIKATVEKCVYLCFQADLDSLNDTYWFSLLTESS